MELTPKERELLLKLLQFINVNTLKAVGPLAEWDALIEKISPPKG